jgi:FkbM family methyltransferase
MNIKSNLKSKLKNKPAAYEIIKNAYHLLRAFKNLFFYKAPSMLDGELDIFRKIYTECEVIFDVGARYDIDYIEISKGNNIRYFLFEINPKFFKKLSNKILKISGEDITLENIGIAEKNKEMFYYVDSESVLQSTTAVHSSSKRLPRALPVTSLDSYVKKAGVSAVDFLKIDIEEYDYFALVGFSLNVEKCKFIQFELGIGAPLGDRRVENKDYFDFLSAQFNLYAVEDENNPLWRDGEFECNLISLDYASIPYIESLQKTGVGFNVLAINKTIEIKKFNFKISGPLRT